MSLHFTESKHFQDRFNFVRDILIILGILFAGVSMVYAGAQSKALKEQIADDRNVHSAQFALDLRDSLVNDRYGTISIAIEGDTSTHSGTFPLLEENHGQFRDTDVVDYASKLDDIATLWQRGLIDESMAYNEFSYDAEKAWCNNDIQAIIKDARATEGGVVGDQLSYNEFQKMAEHFLEKDKKTCRDMDNE